MGLQYSTYIGDPAWSWHAWYVAHCLLGYTVAQTRSLVCHSQTHPPGRPICPMSRQNNTALYPSAVPTRYWRELCRETKISIWLASHLVRAEFWRLAFKFPVADMKTTLWYHERPLGYSLLLYICIIVHVHVHYILGCSQASPTVHVQTPLSSLYSSRYSGTQYKTPSPPSPFPVIPIGRHFGYLG